jgi:hypothetical protein
MALEMIVDSQVRSGRPLADRQRMTEAARAAPVEISRRGKSAVTNGKKQPWNGRSAQARRLKDLILAFSEPFGGFDHLPEFEKALIRNAASMTVTLEDLQARVAAGEKVDIEQLTRLSNSQARALASLRKARLKAPPAMASPAAQLAPVRAPTLEEVIAEQTRRALGSSMVATEAESASAGPDLTGFSDDVLARARRLLESAEGSDG